MPDLSVTVGDLVSISVEVEENASLEVFESLLRRAGDEALRVHAALASTATEEQV